MVVCSQTLPFYHYQIVSNRASYTLFLRADQLFVLSSPMLLTQMFVAIVSLCHEYLYLADQYKHIGYLFTNSEFKTLYFMALTKSSVVVGWKTSSIRRQHELPKVMIYLLSAHIWSVTGFLCFKILWHQKEDLVDDVRYPHVVYVEKPKARDVDFSDEMIYQAKTTSEMEGKNLILASTMDTCGDRER